MTTTIFIQVQGNRGLIEAALPEEATQQDLRRALAEAGVAFDDAALIFIDEDEDPLERDHGEPLRLKRGCRVHVSRCRKIKVTGHYVEQTAERSFAPGTRLKQVKAWAIKTFKLDRHDAAEHVLQLCNSTDRPPTDTPLHELTQAPACSVCFDLVPETRVEG